MYTAAVTFEAESDTPIEVESQVTAWSSVRRLVRVSLLVPAVVVGIWLISEISVGSASTIAADHSDVLNTIECVQQSCPPPPVVDGLAINDLISQNQGVLMIANPQMRCTLAAKAALDAKGIQYKMHVLQTPFAYTSGVSPTWDWLHCKYPDDKQGSTIMHSYVFAGSDFIGQGFVAAARIQEGDVPGIVGAPVRSCEKRFPEDANIVKHYMDNPVNNVLLFGWLSCPCTADAQSRFAGDKVCFDGRTWANPNSNLMKYLQCREAKPDDHSFVYFRNGQRWNFFGNGFQLQESATPKPQLTELLTTSRAALTCDSPTVKRNVYGEPLEECRVGNDWGGSWQDDGTCSEQLGGIHEICVEQLPADFSSATHQGPWSETRAGKRHCVCIGAWSLYMTDADKHLASAQSLMPHCNAIPETALTARYLKNWKNWNGYAASIIKGVGELVSKCMTSATDETKKCGLKKRFASMEASVPELKSSPDLDVLRSRLNQIVCPNSPVAV